MQNRLRSTCVVTLLILGTLGASGASRAHALSLYAGALGGYAASTSEDRNVNPYAVGLGASAGITLPVMPFYVGARVLWYFGDSATFSQNAVGVELNSHYLLYGLDLGYDAELGPLVLRPSLGIGSATLKYSITSLGAKVSTSDSSLYLAPSIGLIIKLGLIYVSGELRYNALTESAHADSVSLLAGLGVTI